MSKIKHGNIISYIFTTISSEAIVKAWRKPGFCSVVVITPDFDFHHAKYSGNPSSNLGKTFFFVFVFHLHLARDELSAWRDMSGANSGATISAFLQFFSLPFFFGAGWFVC